MASFAAGALPVALQFRNLSFSSSHLTPPRSQILGTPLSTPPLISLSSSPQTIPSIYCGRGDRKTAKGKRFNHSFGNSRPKNKNKGRGPPRPPMPPSQPRKDKYDDGEVVKIEIDESLFTS
ncbi:30S ribosomal protein S31, chloroplastic [Cinnamomum micranthum f. kanehirae]|uniref:30S ribosomal protein S31, chloroplastic n=1 Tax=Cinnamomum micranthum f. kanehirae TaxID=337451 RepID=A0A3S3N1L6_9MAGN|nr:30S ribosomal protein S31, chloroplastic [Cinnamomum micranthum f. kanehirae]